MTAAIIEELTGISDSAGLNAFLTHHPELLHGPAVLELAEIARETLRVNPQDSLSIAEAALAIAQRIGEGLPRARALRAKANALWFLNRNQPAVAMYDEASRLFQELGDETEVGRTLSSSLQPLIRLGEYARAFADAERAREIFRKSGDTLRLARLDLNVANILHRQDRFAEALERYEHAYPQLLPHEDKEGIAVALHNMAVCLIALNDLERAQAVYRTAIAACERYGMPALAIQANYNIAYLHYLRGDYSRALEMLRIARQDAGQTGDAYHVALCSMDRSEVYLELNMNQEAADAAREAFNGFQDLRMGYESGKSLANLAVAEGRMGRTPESLRLFAEAKDLFVREGNPVWPSLLNLYRALVLYDAGCLEEAGRLCAEALPFFRDRGMSSKETLCELLAARIRLRIGDSDGARTLCAAALSRMETLEAPHLNYQAQFLMGQIEEANGQFASAIDRYEKARSAAESLRSILRGEELKIAFMKGKLEIYESLVRLFLERAPVGRRVEDAFACMEQAKSRTLRDLLIDGPQDAGDAGGSEQALEIRELREELNWYYHRIEQGEASQEMPTREQVNSLHDEARTREKKLMALLRDLPAAAADQSMPGASVLGLDAIRAVLRPGTQLVEYFRVGDQILAAVLARDSLDVVPLGRMSRVQDLAQLLHFQFAKFRLGPAFAARGATLFLESTNAHLRELYAELVAPIEKQLWGDRLVLIPHESLHQLPLHALFDGDRYLVDRFTVTYAPSAAVYALCGAAPPTAPRAKGSSLILGVPDPQAPFIHDEVHALAECLPNAELFVGEDARRQVLEERGPRSRVVHIATHGRFRRDNPMFSAIRLGDGYLTLYDLYGMRLPVELATLSGCSTGLSVVASGDELMGLVRGLLRAGAQSLLLTLWDVHDRTTADFMKSLYKRYAAGISPGAALRNAMLEVRETHPHPYYWAPFVLIGRA